MKFNLRKNLLTILLLVGVCSGFAQKKKQDPWDFTKSENAQKSIQNTGYVRCASVEMDAIRKAKYPDMQTQEEFENWLAPLMQAKKAEIEQLSSVASYMAVVNIPIIFHIITDGTMPTNIVASQVQAQIDQLNSDFNNLSGSSYGVAASADINFIPAMVDPSGAPLAEPGINRVTAYGAGPFPAGDFDVGGGGLEIKSTGWDYNQYANVWVGGLTGGLLGYAQFPSNSTLPGMATNGGPSINSGVVCGTGTIGSVANPGTAAPYDLGRTLTHEVGHWIGLRHIWGDGDCSVDDFCADTPNASGSNFGCATGNDSCAADAGTDMVENYMDYSDDACMDTFTADQVLRILTVLDNADGLSNLSDSTTGSVDYSMIFTETDMNICETAGNPEFAFNYDASDGFGDTVNFTAVSVPAVGGIAFSQNSANADTNNITVTITGATSGTYVITVTGTYGTETKDVTLNLEVVASAVSNPNLTSPADTATNVADHTLVWDAIINATSYDVNIYDDAGLGAGNLVENATVNTNAYTATTLATQTMYYWTVTASNAVCATSSNVSGANSFETANINCETIVTTDNSLPIPAGNGVNDGTAAGEGSPAVQTISYGYGVTITDVNVTINIPHEWVEDVRLVLTSPAGTELELFANIIGNGVNFTNTVLDDQAATLLSDATGADAPYTGTYQPDNALSMFNGETSMGDWTLSVYDFWDTDNGTLESWSIEICGAPLPDADGDGVPDVTDNCINTPNSDQADEDGDNVGDVCDNCPTVANADQADADMDNIGDVCEDLDGDGILNDVDNCPDVANPGQEDVDGNGVGDACQDTDGDGVLDINDNCPTVANADQADVDGNGVGDACQDTDADGVIDIEDNCPLTANSSQEDANNDGIGDICESIDPADTLTPNGDGQNDTWNIKNIEYVANNTVKVFNRHGIKVFDASNYVNNTWGGESTEGGSGLLPAGSYYYVIEYTSTQGEAKVTKGWMYINY
ncbi:MAG: hypothetical protein COA88_07465 [Kordia sp.]|nr:MAG: hypothetical protein COA88_07465 [Kordia sp.]